MVDHPVESSVLVSILVEEECSVHFEPGSIVGVEHAFRFFFVLT